MNLNKKKTKKRKKKKQKMDKPKIMTSRWCKSKRKEGNSE